MKIVTGVDLVKVSDIQTSITQGKEHFLHRIFRDSELKDQRIEHIAGMFAAKEAVIKAFSLPAGSWHTVTLSHSQEGKPTVHVLQTEYTLVSSDLSITHTDEYALAFYVALVNTE